jgi:hypothetical protein
VDVTRCMDYVQRSQLDENGDLVRTKLGYLYTEPRPCDYPVAQIIHRCQRCLAVVWGDVPCDRCGGHENEVEARCESHKLSDRDILISRGITLPASTERELLARALGL